MRPLLTQNRSGGFFVAWLPHQVTSIAQVVTAESLVAQGSLPGYHRYHLLAKKTDMEL